MSVIDPSPGASGRPSSDSEGAAAHAAAGRSIAFAVAVPAGLGIAGAVAALAAGIVHDWAFAVGAAVWTVASVAIGRVAARRLARSEAARETARAALAERLRKEQAIAALAARAARGNGPATLLPEAAACILSVLGADAATAFEIPEDGTGLVARPCGLAPSASLDAAVLSAVAERASRSPVPLVLEAGPLAAAHARVAVVPILGRKLPVGLFVVTTREGQDFSPDDLATLRSIADLVAASVERSRAEQALRRSEERFRELAENVSEVVWMTDPSKQTMLYVSPSYERIWGRTCASLLAAPTGWLDAVHPDDRARVGAALAQQPLGAWEEQYRIVRPDGTERWIRDRGTPVRDDAGRVVRIVGTAADVTDLRVAQDALHGKEAQFLQAQKMEAVGRLAGGVAHDFNNLLTVIQGYGEIVLARLAPDDRNGTCIAEIVRATERASELTNQLLAFSRQQVLNPAPVGLNAVVSGAGRMLARLIGEDVELVTDLGADVGSVFADRVQIEQMLMNLAVNARDAMPRGGRLRLSTAVVEADAAEASALGLPQSGRWARLEVSDTGTGIDADVLPKIFDPFFTTKERGKGTGLGLATVYGIVKQSGGHITVESAPWKGATFRIWLPEAADDGEDDDPFRTGVRTMDETGEYRGVETVLLVEDDDSVRSIAAEFLASAGYRVLPASDADDALRMLAADRDGIDVLVTDVVLPHGYGPELARQLTAERPAMRVLFTSAHAAGALSEFSHGFGSASFEQKPYTRTRLLRAVRRALDGPPFSSRTARRDVPSGLLTDTTDEMPDLVK